MMSDRAVQTNDDSDVGISNPMHLHQCAGLSHWMQSKSKLATLEHDHVALGDESKGDDWDPCDTSVYRNMRGYQGDLVAVEESNVPPSSKAIGAITKTRRLLTYTNETLVMSSENLTNARSESHPFPMFNINQKIASILAPKNNLSVSDRHLSRYRNVDNFEHGSANVGTSKHHFPSRMLKIVSNETEFPLEEYYCSQPERISQALGHSVPPQAPLERKNLPVSRPFQEDLTGSNFNFVQHGFKSRGTLGESVMFRKKETHPSTSYVHSKELFAKANFNHMERDGNYRRYSTSLLCDNPMDNQCISRNPGSVYSGQNDVCKQQLHDPSIRHLNFPVPVGEQRKKINISRGSGHLSGHTNPPGVSKLKESNHGCCSLFGTPTCSAHGVETMRTCTTVDCLEGVPGRLSKFSKTTHHLLITKKTDVNLSDEDRMVGKSTISTESRGNATTELLGLLPDFDYHVEHRVMRSSSQGKEGVADQTGSLGTKNESSADTEIMDTKVFQTRNYFLGMDSSPSNKDVMVGQNPAKYQVVSPSQEIGRQKRKIEIPDMNQKPPLSTSEGAMENMDLSTSRTESLDMEHPIFHVAHVDRKTSNAQQASLLGLDPSSRWVKRIKLSTSEFVAHGNSRLEDASFTEKASTLLNENVNYSRTATHEPTLVKHFSKKQMELGKNMMLSSKEPSSMGSEKERHDQLLSHSWIRRWRRNVSAAPTIKPSVQVAGEPQSFNVALDGLERKQLPSIAAMALMGKAMSGFQTCEFKNKGSFVVWNSGGEV